MTSFPQRGEEWDDQVSKLNQPIRLPGLKPGVCSGLILSGTFYPDLKFGVWRRRTYQVPHLHFFSEASVPPTDQLSCGIGSKTTHMYSLGILVALWTTSVIPWAISARDSFVWGKLVTRTNGIFSPPFSCSSAFDFKGSRPANSLTKIVSWSPIPKLGSVERVRERFHPDRGNSTTSTQSSHFPNNC